MKLLLVAAALVALASCDPLCLDDLQFEAWKLKHGKTYNSSSEEAHRKEIWLNKHKFVLEHNIKAHQGEKSFHLDMTYFADMNNDEYRNHISKGCLTAFNASRPRKGSTFLSLPQGVYLPESVDWRYYGYVTPVKDQTPHCGSCWAFSATGSLEGQHARKTGNLVSLSEQQLVDCSRNYGNNGCHGGFVDSAFLYIEGNGITTENVYPYEAVDGPCCFYPGSTVAIVTGYVDLPYASELALMQAVATIGPVSVAIDASSPYFQSYRSGVYNDPWCSTQLNHAVLVVGYGNEGGQDYWLVKNSWGSWWGEGGYIKMSRNKGNQCGIASSASYPLV